MAWTLWCAVLNDGAIFRVEIEPQDLVLELQEAVAREMRYTEPAHQLRLVLAKKKDGAWLGANDSDAVRLQSSGRCPTEIYDLLQPELFLSPVNAVRDAIPMEGPGPAPTSSPVIHVLVKKPGLQEPTTLWAFNGSIGNALRVKGARARVYFLAEWFGGYYDPSLRTASAGDKALWYDGDALQISLLFEKGDKCSFKYDNRAAVTVIDASSAGMDASTLTIARLFAIDTCGSPLPISLTAACVFSYARTPIADTDSSMIEKSCNQVFEVKSCASSIADTATLGNFLVERDLRCKDNSSSTGSREE